MKLAHCLALMALLFVIVVTSINCVQNTATPQPSPVVTSTPAPVPTPVVSLTPDQQLNIYNTAIADPYVRERMVKTAWRNTQQVGDQMVTNLSYRMGVVGYMTFREIGPDYERTRVLPAAEIIPGNASQAGVNLVAFVDPDQHRVAYIGFIPRTGVPPVAGATFTSAAAGVDELDPAWDTHRYYDNVTVVNTGYVKGMSLSQDQKDQISMLAIRNATVRGYVGDHGTSLKNFSVYGYETGYPYRYVLAYPLAIIDVTDGLTTYDTIYVLTDLINNRVVRVEHGEQFNF
jgi:hypothetical protein